MRAWILAVLVWVAMPATAQNWSPPTLPLDQRSTFSFDSGDSTGFKATELPIARCSSHSSGNGKFCCRNTASL